MNVADYYEIHAVGALDIASRANPHGLGLFTGHPYDQPNNTPKATQFKLVHPNHVPEKNAGTTVYWGEKGNQRGCPEGGLPSGGPKGTAKQCL